MEDIKAWLNESDKDYGEGVLLFEKYSTDKYEIALVKKREDAFNKKLIEKFFFYLLKKERPIAQRVKARSETAPTSSDLLAKVKADALNAYKELQNKKAVLFSMCRLKKYAQENAPGNIAKREPLALDILQLSKESDAKYEVLRYVEKYGRLPYVPDQEPKAVDGNLAALKYAKTNLQKSLSKLRKKEATPKRLQMIADREAKVAEINTKINEYS